MLLLRVVDLAERVAELHPAGEVLEALHERRVVVGRPRERRELDRVVVEDRRLDQVRLDEGLRRVVDELRPVACRATCRRPARRAQPAARRRRAVQSPCSASASASCSRRHGAFRSTSWPRKVDLRRPERRERDPLDEVLDPHHRVVVVGVRLVPLEHRELGRVLVRDALVAEVLADLVDALEPADDQPLQVELGRDPQVDVLVELVVVGDEGAREGAAVARLQHRRLDLEEAVARRGRAGSPRPTSRPGLEVAPRLLVHQQVEVALAVALLDVGETVERVRERRRGSSRAARTRRPASDGSPRRDFAGWPLDPDDVAEVDVDLAARAAGSGRSVDEVEEGDLPHLAPRKHAPRQAERLRLVRRARLDLLGHDADGRDLVPVGEALRQHRASLDAVGAGSRELYLGSCAAEDR